MNKIEKYKQVYIGLGIFAGLIYFPLLSNGLTNSDDGVWHTTAFTASDWERSIGRWFWIYLDKIKFGINSITLNNILSLMIMVLGLILCMECLKVEKTLFRVLGGMLFLTYPIVCDILSYSYMSTTFAMAFLLSVIAARSLLAQNNSVILGGLGSVAIACSMGCYQAYIGVTCLILLVDAIKQFCQEKEIKTTFYLLLKEGIFIAIGGVLYYGIVKLHCKIYGVTLADYKGAGSTSIKNIVFQMPETIKVTYSTWADFFWKNSLQTNPFWYRSLSKLMLCIISVLLLIKVIQLFKEKMYFHICFIIGLILMLPVGCNLILLLVPGSKETILMTGAMALVFPVFLWSYDNEKWIAKYIHAFGVLISIILIWNNILTVTNDQAVMNEGRKATYTVAEQVLNSLQQEGADLTEEKVTIVGKASSYPNFGKRGNWYWANSYAQYGQFIDSPECIRMSWDGVYWNLFGLSLQMAEDDVTSKVKETNEFKNMNVYPENGSIEKINNIWVVKLEY